MDPFSLFLGAISAGGKLYEGFAGSRVAGINAAIMRDNAQLLTLQAETAKEEADFAHERGAYDAARLRRQVNEITGSQIASFAARGFDPTIGSPLQTIARTIVQGETDAELIGANAKAEAAKALARAGSLYGGASSAAWQALASDERANSSVVAGVLGAGTALLTQARGWRYASGGGPNWRD